MILFKKTRNRECCICDFPIKSRTANGWFDHVCKAEYLFLENIFSAKEMYQMGISTFDIYFSKINKILEYLDDFCEDLEQQHKISLLDNKPNPELEKGINEIQKIKINGEEENEVTKKKVLDFLYKQSIKFLATDKIYSSGSCLIVSEKFLINLFYIYTDCHVFHLVT